MLSFSLVAEALTGLIYHRPSGENSKFLPFLPSTLCQMMGKYLPKRHQHKQTGSRQDKNCSFRTLYNMISTEPTNIIHSNL